MTPGVKYAILEGETMKVGDLFKELINCNLDANLIIKSKKSLLKGLFEVETDNKQPNKQKEIVLYVGTKNVSD